MGGSDCSETGGVEDVPPTTPLAPLQPPFPKTPPINEAGVNSPAHKSLVGDTGVTGLHSDPSATCGSSEKVAGFEGQEFNGPPRDSTDPRANVDEAEYDPDDYVSEVKLDACLQCNAVGADVDWYQHDLHEVPEGIGICMPCMDDTELGRLLLLQLKVEFGERQNSQ